VAYPLNCKCEVACDLLYQYFVICLGHRRTCWDVRTVRRSNTVQIMSLASALNFMRFFQCKADSYLLTKDCETKYKCDAFDILYIGKERLCLIILVNVVSKPSYHFNGYRFRYPDGTLAWGSSASARK
jgi:hypothetical protein